MMYDIAIVGGGIVGASSFYELQKRYPEKSIVLLEKEAQVGMHQTGRNSGVIHSGIYYKPGSYKAKNCKRGRELLVDFAQKHQIKHEVCGKVIVATQEQELSTLKAIYEKGIENKTPDIELIDADQIQQIEPFCTSAIKAIRVGCSGIIDYKGLNEKLIDIASALNDQSSAFFSHQVQDIIKQSDHVQIKTSKQLFQAKKVITCAGLWADKVSGYNKVKLESKIVPFRGDYYELTPTAMHKVKHLIYPVPDVDFPFLGVHFTRMVLGGVECGPNAVFSFKREGYNKTSFSLSDTVDALAYAGTWRLFSKHWRKGLEEYKRAFSKKLFHKTLQRLIPSLEIGELQEARSGVRAQALTSKGGLVDDFNILTNRHSINIINAPSPAATSCLAIAEHVADLYTEQI